MTENRNIEINNDPILKDFLEFIEPEENIDIIVSAPFGSGKTVFLRDDFDIIRYINKELN